MEKIKTSFGVKNLVFGVGGILLAVLVYFLVPAGEGFETAPQMAAIVALMAVWWIFEVIPIPVTSILPIVLFPLFGIMGIEGTTAHFGKSTIFLFLGGFMLALGLQKTMVHKRIALMIVNLIGGKPASLVLGFMLATGFMSMWISNTATVMVMLPIALSVIDQASSGQIGKKDLKQFALALMLGIAYSADIGGMTTFIGTAPNLVYRDMLTTLFPEAPTPGFIDWMLMGVPLSITFVFSGWLLLTRVIFRLNREDMLGGKAILEDNLKALGKIRTDEVLSMVIFGVAALLWLTGGKIEWSADVVIFRGWRDWLGLQEFNDAAVAILAALLLFMIPSNDRKGESLLRWSDTKQIPWGILLLFGGGFAIAGGFTASGLSVLTGQMFEGFHITSPIIWVIVICLILTFLTEVTSNTAITNLVLPILATASVAMGMDPRILMIPAALSASCAFMMPVASPTQAIVFGSGHVPIRQMIRAGIWFNFLGIILVTVVFLSLAKVVWGIDMGVVPDWAIPKTP